MNVSADFRVANGGGIAAFNCMIYTLGTDSIESAAESFLGACASLPYDGANPEGAKAWVSETLATQASSQFGGVYYHLGAGQPGLAFTLSISPLR
jgi:hypothetical protein